MCLGYSRNALAGVIQGVTTVSQKLTNRHALMSCVTHSHRRGDFVLVPCILQARRLQCIRAPPQRVWNRQAMCERTRGMSIAFKKAFSDKKTLCEGSIAPSIVRRAPICVSKRPSGDVSLLPSLPRVVAFHERRGLGSLPCARFPAPSRAIPSSPLRSPLQTSCSAWPVILSRFFGERQGACGLRDNASLPCNK